MTGKINNGNRIAKWKLYTLFCSVLLSYFVSFFIIVLIFIFRSSVPYEEKVTECSRPIDNRLLWDMNG